MAAADFAANVIRLPQRAAEAAVARAGAPLKPLAGPFAVDDWGRDQHLIELLEPAARLRWRMSVSGLEHLPTRAGALVVCNNRNWSYSPVAAALALSRVSGRPVRFAGRPDVAPAGPFLRRLGGILARPDELAGALNGGEVVVLGMSTERTARTAGTLAHEMLQPAVLGRHAVLPAAVVTSPWRRAARLRLGAPVRLNAKRRGPLAEVELVDTLNAHVQQMLDEMGPI